MKIDFEKIVNQSLTTLVVAVFIGACTIVWRGATSVDDKVKKNSDSIQHLIDSLSDKLADTQVQFLTISNQFIMNSNQLYIIQRNQEKFVQSSPLVGFTTLESPSIPLRPVPTYTPTNEPNYDKMMKRGVYRNEIRQQLLPTK